MRIPPFARVLSLWPLVLAACATEPTPPSPTWAPMPLGETALRPHAVTITHPSEIDLTWSDARGHTWSVAFRCTYTSDDAHEALAAVCVQSNWAAAVEAARAICSTAYLYGIDGFAACEQRLQAELSDVLFPCEAGEAIGRVSGIAWTRVLAR